MSSQVVLVSGWVILVTHGRQSLSNLYLILKTWVSYLGLFHCIGLLIHCQWIVWIFYFDYYLYYLYYKYVPKSPHWNKGDLHVLRYHIVTFPPTLYYAGGSVPMVQFIALTPVTLFRSARQGPNRKTITGVRLLSTNGNRTPIHLHAIKPRLRFLQPLLWIREPTPRHPCRVWSSLNQVAEYLIVN